MTAPKLEAVGAPTSAVVAANAGTSLLGKAAGVVLPIVGPALLSAGLKLISGLFGGRDPATLWPIAARTNKADEQAGVPVLCGVHDRVGLVIENVVKDPTDPTIAWVVGVLCHGASDGNGVSSIQEIYFDDTIAFNAAGVAQGVYASLGCAVYKFLGTDAQDVGGAAGGLLRTRLPAVYPSTCKGAGLAALVFALKQDDQVFNGTSLPKITAVVTNRCYDPRDGTWKASSTPALWIYDYLTSTRYGYGLPASALDVQSFKDIATAQEAMTARCNGFLDTTRSLPDNLQILLSSCRGIIVDDGGPIRLVQYRSGVSAESLVFDESLWVGPVEVALPSMQEAPNTIRFSYWDLIGNQVLARQAMYPRTASGNSYLTADNGVPVIRDVQLGMTRGHQQAEELVSQTIAEARGARVRGRVRSTAWQVRVGDLVPVRLRSVGWGYSGETLTTPIYCWVVSMEWQPDGLLAVELLQQVSGAYTISYAGAPPTPPTGSLPPPLISFLNVNTTSATAAGDVYVPSTKLVKVGTAATPATLTRDFAVNGVAARPVATNGVSTTFISNPNPAGCIMQQADQPSGTVSAKSAIMAQGLMASVRVPDSCTITAVSAYAEVGSDATSTGTLAPQLKVYRGSDSTLLGTATGTYGGASYVDAETLTVTLSETTGAGNTYLFVLGTANNAGAYTSYVKLWNFKITITVADYARSS